MLPTGLALYSGVAYLVALGPSFFKIRRLREHRSRLGMRRALHAMHWPEIGGIALSMLLGVAAIAAGAWLGVASL